MEQAISRVLMAAVKKAQVDELTGEALYAFMARRERKSAENRRILTELSEDERSHAAIWQEVTGQALKPSRAKILFLKLLTCVLGFTFVLKTLQKDEALAQEVYRKMQQELPAAARMLNEERRHEDVLSAMLDEERLHYIGSMVLGLNDALVELTGAIAGVTFALCNTRTIALTGIVTGVSATLSMAASNYLAERAQGNANALKSSAYTGVAYLVTVALLVLPYLLFPSALYAAAFGVMLGIVILIILFFNYYLSVARDEPFLRRFGEMAVISLSVAVISFLIAIAAKKLLGIDVG